MSDVDFTRQKLKAELAASQLQQREPDSFTLIVDGLEIPVKSAKVLRTMDTASDTWTASIAWTPGLDPALDAKLKPYLYNTASVYLGGEQVVSGILYTISVELSDTGRLKHLIGYSYTADVIDSVLNPPYEKNNVTLAQRARGLVEPLGINVIFNVDTDGQFDRVTAEPIDTIFEHLSDLAAQRGVLISSSNAGDMVFQKANTTGSPVGTLEEGQPPVLNFSVTFDGRKRFNTYRAIGQSPGSNSKVGTATDEGVPRSRFLTFQADDTIQGDIQKAAEWKRSKQLAEALTIPLPVSTWYAPNGELWKENTLITLKSSSLHLPDGFTFLIRSVEFTYEETGTTAVLNLVPPQVYTGEPIEEVWS